MRILVSLIFVFAHSAEANPFGIGMAPGMQCPYPYGPAAGAYQGDDQIRNLVGGLANAERKLDRQEKKLSELNAQIAAAKSKIKRVIKSPSALSDIERHYKYKANPEDYSQACGRRERSGRTASGGSPGSNVTHRPSRGTPADGQEDPGRYAVPSDFCQGGVNDWQHVVAQDGMVLDEICDYEIPLARRPPDESRSAECRDGLATYYDKQAKKEALEAEVRSLKDKVNAFNEDKERIQDQIAEGTYCPHCHSQRRGQNQMGTGNFAMMGVSILGALFNRQPQQQPQPVLVAVPRRGPPGVLPYGGRPGGPQTLPFPGPSAYPGRPYAAPMPGYAGVQPGYGRPGTGYYGGAPGGIGQGSFGCQGTSPFGIGNPLAAPFDPFQNSRANVFANPHAYDPYSQFGQGQNYGGHPLLNPGYGPGFAPHLGNGIPGYNQYDPFQQYQPYNQFGQNAPGGLLYQGGPFGANAFGPPGALPYYSQYGGSPYGGTPYSLGAPAVLPYQQSGSPYPYATNMPYMAGGVGNPWGAPYALNPVQNYGYQMNQLRQGVSQIGNGLYGGGAPAVLPYIGGAGSGPIYTQPIRTPTNRPAPGIIPAR
jgi:hypothetical protein